MQIPQFSAIILKLPDGKIILQRRTQDALHGAGLLGAFGGWMEKGETPEECIMREIAEETSLDPNLLEIKLVGEVILPANEDFDRDRRYHVFETIVRDSNFEVYEGDGYEVFTLAEARDRNDMITSTRLIFNKLYKI